MAIGWFPYIEQPIHFYFYLSVSTLYSGIYLKTTCRTAFLLGELRTVSLPPCSRPPDEIFLPIWKLFSSAKRRPLRDTLYRIVVPTTGLREGFLYKSPAAGLPKMMEKS